MTGQLILLPSLSREGVGVGFVLNLFYSVVVKFSLSNPSPLLLTFSKNRAFLFQ
jgi:hypothetical protein